MSQTITDPDAANAGWFARMKAAFGGSATVAPISALDERLATLRKTFDAIRVQPPEVAMRPMQDVAGELTAIELGGDTAPRGLAGFQREVAAALDGLKGRAAAIVAGHVKDWKAKLAKLPAAAADAVAAKKAVRAKAIQTLLQEMEPGIERDTYMLSQVGGDLAPLQALTAEAATLKSNLKTLQPQRETAGAAKVLPDAAKPRIKGQLTEDEQKRLAAVMKQIQGVMGADGQTDVAKVAEAVALIAKGIDVLDARQELRTRKTWDGVKARYRELIKAKQADAAEQYMAKMWWYRRMTVDKTMIELQSRYDFIWGSVGSDNPESDYDLTVRTHCRAPTDKMKWDYQVVQEANRILSADFGVPPGVLFDTNLYAEAAVAPKVLSPEEEADPAVSGPGKGHGRYEGAGPGRRCADEVAAVHGLGSVRRLQGGHAGQDQRPGRPRRRVAAVRRGGRALFQGASEQLLKAAEGNPKEIAAIKAIPLTPEGQKQLLDRAEALEHDPIRSMATNNDLYLAKLNEVRAIEPSTDGERDPVKKAGLLARLKSYQADATFFAAEAYHSEGPLQHVVKAGQSSRLEIEANGTVYATKADKDLAINNRKQEKLAALSPNQMLQSFNENLGDLLKDLRHYGNEPFPGLGFYRSSKYIERLCDAYSVIAPKLPEAARADFNRLTLGDKPPAAVQAAVAGLVEIRGEKKGFPPEGGVPADPEQEKQAYAIEQMTTIFPHVVTLPDLAKVMTKFGQDVNAMVRSAITKDMEVMNANPYFPKAA